MILTADIGNTNITLGLFDGDEAIFISRLATQRHRTSEQYAIELNAIFNLEGINTQKIEGSVISSVVPELTRVFKDAIEKLSNNDYLLLHGIQGVGKTRLSIEVAREFSEIYNNSGLAI